MDEVSLVGSNFFFMLDQRLRNIMGSEKVFGGLSVLFFGDLFQLPPVVDSYIFESPKHAASGYSNIVASLWDMFEMFELTRVMRQSGVEWAGLLNRLRIGEYTPDDIRRLRRLYDNVVPPGSVRGCRLVANAEKYNADALERSASTKHYSTACDSIQGEVPFCFVYIQAIH